MDCIIIPRSCSSFLLCAYERSQFFRKEDQHRAEQVECSSNGNFNPAAYWGLKKWTLIPMVAIFHIAPMTTKILRIIPEAPNAQLRYQLALCFLGFLISIHMRHGYANVRGNATPPSSPAKLRRNGSDTEIKNVRHPKRALIAERSHHGHGLLNLLVYLNSKLSNTGIA